MSRRRISSILLLLLLYPGCAVSDVIFNALGQFYSGGGETRAERRWDYDKRVEASQEREYVE